MEPIIYLAFVDDWEVRGNGTGHPRILQFEPMRRLARSSTIMGSEVHSTLR